MALSAGRLVIGFNVGMQPKLEGWVKEHGVEVRLYNVIYYMAEDLKKIAESMISREPEEKILGRGEVIAKFKSSHGAVIAGCTVQEGGLRSEIRTGSSLPWGPFTAAGYSPCTSKSGR